MSPGLDDEARQRAAATKRQRTQKAILGAALTLFDEKGWAGTTLEEIAQRAGIGVATLYNHYSTKASLLDPLARQLVEDIMTDVDAEEDTKPDPVDFLKRYVHRLARLFLNHRQLIIAMLSADIGEVDGTDEGGVIFIIWLCVHSLSGPLFRILNYGAGYPRLVFRLEDHKRLNWSTLAHYHTRSLMMMVAFEPHTDIAEYVLSQLLPALTYAARPDTI